MTDNIVLRKDDSDKIFEIIPPEEDESREPITKRMKKMYVTVKVLPDKKEESQ